MKNNNHTFQTKIGLEIHVRLNSQRKLFSSTLNQLHASPNHYANSYDLGYPGALPRLNCEALKLATRASTLLNFELDTVLSFDRKNYYYFDLPKGYQITQFYRPLAKNGYLLLFFPKGKQKRINLTSAHLEEDTAKIIHQNDQLLADYNRSGMPLLEIVTKPDFTNFEEVELFLKTLIWLFAFTKISDMKFEEGSIRVDVNISQQLDNQTCPLTEIKNLNSLKNIKKAILQEANHQQNHFGTLKKACTKMFDEDSNSLKMMRHKFTKLQYFFIRENNIVPIDLDQQQRQQWTKDLQSLTDFTFYFRQSYSQLTNIEYEFLFSDVSHIFYFCLLMNGLGSDHQTILLFLKQIFKPLFLQIKTKIRFSGERVNETIGFSQSLFAFLLAKSHDSQITFFNQSNFTS